MANLSDQYLDLLALSFEMVRITINIVSFFSANFFPWTSQRNIIYALVTDIFLKNTLHLNKYILYYLRVTYDFCREKK